jgi:hypothetical protein
MYLGIVRSFCSVKRVLQKFYAQFEKDNPELGELPRIWNQMQLLVLGLEKKGSS